MTIVCNRFLVTILCIKQQKKEQLAHFVEAAINSKSLNLLKEHLENRISMLQVFNSFKDNIHHNMSFYEEKTNFDIYIQTKPQGKHFFLFHQLVAFYNSFNIFKYKHMWGENVKIKRFFNKNPIVKLVNFLGDTLEIRSGK